MEYIVQDLDFEFYSFIEMEWYLSHQETHIYELNTELVWESC